MIGCIKLCSSHSQVIHGYCVVKLINFALMSTVLSEVTTMLQLKTSVHVAYNSRVVQEFLKLSPTTKPKARS